ncbi:MAG: hypothetical protein KKH92_01170 [Firmicutes bacterium]|nr:hypothetical protein [Bacillota bacterium]
MNEKDPFAKYDKLFEEQDKEHDQQVKTYRNEIKTEDSPSFDDFKDDEIRNNPKKSTQNNQAVGIFISVIVGVIVLQSVFSSSTGSFSNIFAIFIIIGIVSSIYKYFKNKR